MELPLRLLWQNDGTAALLDRLELAVMEALWAGQGWLKDIAWRVDRDYGPRGRTTIHVALSRLEKKGYAIRTGHVWRAAVSEDELKAAARARLEALLETLI